MNQNETQDLEELEVGQFSQLGYIYGADKATKIEDLGDGRKLVTMKPPDGSPYQRIEKLQSRIIVTVQMELPEWMRKELEERRGFDERPTDIDLINEVEDAVYTRFGGCGDWRVLDIKKG